MKKDEAQSLDRRAFLCKSGFGLGAAGAVAAMVAREAGATETELATGGKGYTETAHVRKYYELARF
mgnify:CR=1 FL=1